MASALTAEFLLVCAAARMDKMRSTGDEDPFSNPQALAVTLAATDRQLAARRRREAGGSHRSSRRSHRSNRSSRSPSRSGGGGGGGSAGARPGAGRGGGGSSVGTFQTAQLDMEDAIWADDLDSEDDEDDDDSAFEDRGEGAADVPTDEEEKNKP